MKKIYLLLVLCCLNVPVYATRYYSVVLNGNVNVPGNWNTSIIGSGTPAVNFDNPLDTFELTVNMRMPNADVNWQVAGTLLLSGTNARIIKPSNFNDTISVGKKLIMLKGTSIVTGLNTTRYFGVHVFGDLDIRDSAYITRPSSLTPPQYVGDNIIVRFCDTASSYSSPKTIKWSTKTDTAVANGNVNRNTAIVFDRRSVRKLMSNIPVPVFALGGVKVYGTLICDTFKMYSHSTDTFTIDSGAHLYTAHANGIDHSIQDMKYRDFSSEAHYYYDGLVAQTTGTTLPNNFAEPGSVTIMNNAGVQLSQSTIFAAGSMVNLDFGPFDHANLLTMAANSLVNVDSGDFTSAPMYNPSVHVTYKDIGLSGYNTPVTGWALRPILPAGVGKLTIDKPMSSAVVALGSDVTINDTVLLKAGLLDAGLVTGGPYNITAKGNWTNNSGIGAYFYAFGGTVKLAGTAQQMIGGTYPTRFGNLEVNKSGGVAVLDVTAYVENQLTLNNGSIDINEDTLVLEYSAMPIDGTPGNNSKIIADSTGIVMKMTYGELYSFPIGDDTSYAPIEVNMTGAPLSTPWMGVNARAVKHPNNANVTNYTRRYWRLFTNDLLFLDYSVKANYWDADAVGSEANISMGKYAGALPWTKYGPAVTGSNELSATGLSDAYAEFTGISTPAPSLVAPLNVRICDSASATLTATSPTGDPGLTYKWTPGTNLSSTTTLATVVSSSVTGVTTYTITITDGNGFEGYATTTVTISPTPRISEIKTYGAALDNAACLNTDLYLKAVPSSLILSYSWAGPVAISTGGTTANETVYTVTPAASGVYTLTISNGTEPGCTAVHMTPAATVNPLPGAPVITTEGALSEFCVSTVMTVTPTGLGTVSYQGNTSGGTAIDFLIADEKMVDTTGIYYFRSVDLSTACWGPESSKAVTINPLPAEYPVTVNGLLTDGKYCQNGTGLNVGLNGSDLGIKYILYREGIATGDTLDGTGAALDYGVFTEVGGYTVMAKNPATGCLQPYTGIPVRIDTVKLPIQQPMNGNGGYCDGTTTGYSVKLMSSEAGVDYQLYFKDTATGSLTVPVGSAVAGTFTEIDFGFQTGLGKYSVIATEVLSGLSCATSIDSTDSVYIHPLPHVYSMVKLNDTLCDGFVFGTGVFLDSSDSWVSYTLYENGFSVGAPYGGSTGWAPVNFGLWPNVSSAPGLYQYTVSASDSNSCVSNMNGIDTIVVAPAPLKFNVTGDGSFCAGTPVAFSRGLDGSQPGIRYEMYNYSFPIGIVLDGTGGPLDFDTTSIPGQYIIIATDTLTGCVSEMNDNALIVENILPGTEALLGGGHYCDGVPPGMNISMTGYSLDPNVHYNLYHETAGLVAGITGTADFGSHMTGGRYYAIAVNLSSGCQTPVNDTVEVIVDSLPHVQNVIGGGEYCVNDTTAHHIGLFNSQSGVDYTLFRDGTNIGVFSGTGTAMDFGTTVVTGSYTVTAENATTGCTSNMSGSASIVAHPIPVAFDVNGGGRYCEGTGGPLVILTGSETDVNYQLYRNGLPWGSPVAGSTLGLNFGPQDSAGHYTVFATNTITGCYNPMDSFAFVTIKPMPVVFDVAGAGPYCSGDTGNHVYLSASYVGTEYQLYRDGSPEGAPMAGTGFGLDFGQFTTPGSYTVVAKLLSDSCTINMRYTVVLFVNPLPTVFSMTGSGTICADSAGVPIGLSGSQTDVRYQLYNGTTPVGTPVDGTGGAISFGLHNVAGTYKVAATSLLTACVDTMSGTAVVIVNSLPTPYAVTGGGDYCEGDGGLSIGLANSETGVIYQLYTGGVPVAAPQLGTGSSIDFGLIPTGGTYIAKAVGPSGCANVMSGSTAIVVNPLPDVFNVTGGGSYCEGGSGVLVLLDGSKPGIAYQLYAGLSAIGSPRLGTGSVINFGYQRPDSTYTVMATDTTTHCTKKMDGNAVVTIIPYTAPTVTLTANPGTLISVGEKATVVATVTGAGLGTPTFAWRINRNPVPGEYSNTLNFTMYYDNDTIECDVMSHGVCGGVVTTKRIIFHLKPVGVQEIASLNGVIRLLPNPNKGVFSLKGSLGMTGDEELHAEVTNMLGQVVYSSKITARNGEVDEQIQLGGNLANGMYLLNLRSSNASGVFHFVVEQ